MKFSSVSEPPSILSVCVQSEPDVPVSPHNVLTGISLTLPDGTMISIRRGSAEAVVSFLKLYSRRPRHVRTRGQPPVLRVPAIREDEFGCKLGATLKC